LALKAVGKLRPLAVSTASIVVLRGELNGGVGWLPLRSSIMHLVAAGTMVATALRAIVEAEKDKEKK